MYSYSYQKYFLKVISKKLARNCTKLALFFIKTEESKDNELGQQNLFINVKFLIIFKPVNKEKLFFSSINILKLFVISV